MTRRQYTRWAGFHSGHAPLEENLVRAPGNNAVTMAQEGDSLLGSHKMNAPQGPQRNKSPARFYHGLLTVVFLVLFLDSIISLGTFGMVQAKVHGLVPDDAFTSGQCILFGTQVEKFGEIKIRLSRVGSCAFVLWGQVSIVIVSFVWIVFSIVMAVVAPRM